MRIKRTTITIPYRHFINDIKNIVKDYHTLEEKRMNKPVNKLSKTQQRALEKLTDEWQSGYKLGEKINTLKVLVNKGLAIEKRERGYSYMPRTCIVYKKKEN